MARVVGLLVLASPFVSLFIWAGIKVGLLALLPIAFAVLVVWAIGAVIYEEWWPFRHL